MIVPCEDWLKCRQETVCGSVCVRHVDGTV